MVLLDGKYFPAGQGVQAMVLPFLVASCPAGHSQPQLSELVKSGLLACCGSAKIPSGCSTLVVPVEQLPQVVPAGASLPNESFSNLGSSCVYAGQAAPLFKLGGPSGNCAPH